MSTPPTDHVRVVTRPDLWLEGEALVQLERVSQFPGCIRAVGMPDLHPGPGIPIGAAFAFVDHIRPLLVGGDAGCGVCLVGVPQARGKQDALERRVDAAFTGPALPEAHPRALLHAVWTHGPRGLASVDGVPDSLAHLAESIAPEAGDALPDGLPDEMGAALGTIGAGNHFAEVSRVQDVVSRPEAEPLGLRPGGLAVVVHSGSRGLGRWLIDRWGDVDLSPADAVPYQRQLAGAVRFARANRLVLAWRLLQALGALRDARHGPLWDIVHNTIDTEHLDGQCCFVHRKGAAPAYTKQPTVLLGSRGTPSVVMAGHGNPETLWSIAHGCGRKLSRTDAIARFRSRNTRASLVRTSLGGRVLCDDNDLLFAEHPDAYKALGPVLAATLESDAAHAICSLHPLVTVKR